MYRTPMLENSLAELKLLEKALELIGERIISQESQIELLVKYQEAGGRLEKLQEIVKLLNFPPTSH